jgi:dolichol-phosphate mannosyltransferase
LNEEAGLAKTLAELARVTTFREGRIPEILVVDGRSTDRTLEIARQYRCTILTQRGRGKGAAIREGLGWAQARGFGLVGVLDADATYPSERLPALFRLLELGADVVVGLRRPDQLAHRTARDLVHRIGNGWLNLCAGLFSRGPVLDVCSGFWGLRTAIVPRLALESNGFEIESELFVKSFRLGLRVVQIPVTYRERTGIAKLQASRDGARIFLSIIRQSHRASGFGRVQI